MWNRDHMYSLHGTFVYGDILSAECFTPMGGTCTFFDSKILRVGVDKHYYLKTTLNNYHLHNKLSCSVVDTPSITAYQITDN